MRMAFACRRRSLSPLFTIFALCLIFVSILPFILKSDRVFSIINEQIRRTPRLFCILIDNEPEHERFLRRQEQSWLRHCYTVAVVKYRPRLKMDINVNPSQSSYSWGLWTRIMAKIRESIHNHLWISPNDTLLIVPAASFVFARKIPNLWKQYKTNSMLPAIIVHQQRDRQAYIMNGAALDQIYRSKLMEICLAKAYSSSIDSHLWTCLKYHFRRDLSEVPCENDQCFVYHDQSQLTIDHIKNGSCLGENLSRCQSITLLYPITFEEMITLEFFKYRLRPRDSL